MKQVLVTPKGKRKFPIYICMPVRDDKYEKYKCGHCLRGNLFPQLKSRQQCKVCKFVICQVIK